jgi:hypothetical protein
MTDSSLSILPSIHELLDSNVSVAVLEQMV